ncbi:MAG: hypothetical protein E7533_06710 [Ruminococcaceae bacterium]|nr:hypothetical protein [Oscillospiraceae bacterium]
MSNENFVPQWILESTTAPHEVNKDVDKIVGSYVAAFMKRGFSQKDIGCLMVQAFTQPLEEVEKRIDCLLSCGEKSEVESAKKLCVFAASKGFLFAGDESDPCEVISFLKTKYGNKAAFETVLTYPEILSVWKKADVRENEKYKAEKQKAEYILNEVASVFPEI